MKLFLNQDYKIDFKNIFFVYLVYLLGVVSTLFFSWQFGFINIAFHYDESYFTLLISALYGIFETVCGIKIYQLSKTIIKAKKHLWLMRQMKNLTVFQRNDVVFYGDGHQLEYEIEDGYLRKHILDLLNKKAASGKKITNKTLLSTVSSTVVEKHNIAYTFTEVLIWLGLIGTILGIILTFYPFITGTVIIDANNAQHTLAIIFKGVGSAFFPSIVAAIYSLFLKVSDFILIKGSNELVTLISDGSDITISPTINNPGVRKNL